MTNQPLREQSYEDIRKEMPNPMDYIGRRTIELYPFDFLSFFPCFAQYSEKFNSQNMRTLNMDRTLELYQKKESDSISIALESDIEIFKSSVFHIEIQTRYDNSMNSRMLDYKYMIHKKTGKIVRTLLINLDENAKSNELGYAQFGPEMEIRYEVVNLWQRSYEVIKRSKKYALLVFTPYLEGSTKESVKEASQVIYNNVQEGSAEMLFMLAILAGRRYSFGTEIVNGIDLFSNDAKMDLATLRRDPTIGSLLQVEEQRGREEGREEGIIGSVQALMNNTGQSLDQALVSLGIQADMEERVRAAVTREQDSSH
ncbi:hypothetical protein HON22_03855 [Candidatus Peregrinibacteria bacterium]|jgi:hypothetical protein|nr:hypothetical protein [Candidatus Peregrinibacteria bacterium]